MFWSFVCPPLCHHIPNTKGRPISGKQHIYYIFWKPWVQGYQKIMIPGVTYKIVKITIYVSTNNFQDGWVFMWFHVVTETFVEYWDVRVRPFGAQPQTSKKPKYPITITIPIKNIECPKPRILNPEGLNPECPQPRMSIRETLSNHWHVDHTASAPKGREGRSEEARRASS